MGGHGGVSQRFHPAEGAPNMALGSLGGRDRGVPGLWPATSAPTCPHVRRAGPWGAANLGSPAQMEGAVGRPTARSQTGGRAPFSPLPGPRASVDPPSRGPVPADPKAPCASTANTESVTRDVDTHRLRQSLLGTPSPFQAPHLPPQHPVSLSGTPSPSQAPRLPPQHPVSLSGTPSPSQAPHVDGTGAETPRFIRPRSSRWHWGSPLAGPLPASEQEEMEAGTVKRLPTVTQRGGGKRSLGN